MGESTDSPCKKCLEHSPNVDILSRCEVEITFDGGGGRDRCVIGPPYQIGRSLSASPRAGAGTIQRQIRRDLVTSAFCMENPSSLFPH